MREWIEEGVVEILGAADDVRPHIAAADCVVLPSYREGLPRTLLEAAAMGRPLIATDVPGCREVVLDGENGFLCTARDVTSLADAMRRMAGLSDVQRGQLGAAGRTLVEQRFDERFVHRAYLDEIADILRSGREAHRAGGPERTPRASPVRSRPSRRSSDLPRW